MDGGIKGNEEEARSTLQEFRQTECADCPLFGMKGPILRPMHTIHQSQALQCQSTLGESSEESLHFSPHQSTCELNKDPTSTEAKKSAMQLGPEGFKRRLLRDERARYTSSISQTGKPPTMSMEEILHLSTWVSSPIVYMARIPPPTNGEGPGGNQDDASPQNQEVTSTAEEDGMSPVMLDTDQSSASRSAGTQPSSSGMQSPETAPSTSLSRATQSSVQPSSGEASTPIRSVFGSAYLTPHVPVTPVPSPAQFGSVQGMGPPASRLSYRLELEKRRSSDGVVQQMRFAERDMLPGENACPYIHCPQKSHNCYLTPRSVKSLIELIGETPGESSTSRVNNWLDGESRLDGTVDGDGDEEMRMFSPTHDYFCPPGFPSANLMFLEYPSASQPEQHRERLLEHSADESPDEQDEGMEQRAWEELTEEEKQERRDSAYKSRQGSLVNPNGGNRK